MAAVTRTRQDLHNAIVRGTGARRRGTAKPARPLVHIISALCEHGRDEGKQIQEQKTRDDR